MGHQVARRRLLQYGLRTVLAMTLAVAVFFGWVHHLRRQYARQAAAIQQIERLGGRVYLDYEQPTWAMGVLVGGNYRRVERVEFDYCTRLRNDDLQCLADLVQLHVLTLRGCFQIDNGGISHMAAVSTLSHISVNGTSIDDEGYARLRDMKNLKTIAFRSGAEPPPPSPGTMSNY